MTEKSENDLNILKLCYYTAAVESGTCQNLEMPGIRSGPADVLFQVIICRAGRLCKK